MPRPLVSVALLALLSGAVACDKIPIPPIPAPRCVAVVGDLTPTATAVCSRLAALACNLPDCNASYADYGRRLSRDEFNRLTSCYVHATSCDEADQCERACGADGGAVIFAPVIDAGAAADAAFDR